jgi:hypothetical protein
MNPSQPGSASPAFVFITHFWNLATLREFKKIERSVEGLGTAWFVFQGEREHLPKRPPIANLHTISREELLALDFPMPSAWILPGSSHFPLLHFYRTHPDYSAYWLIEYDVRYSGSWRSFFGDLEKIRADFMAAHICRYADEPDWPSWKLTHPTKSIAIEKRLRCFHPICRISKPALECIYRAHQEGWCGHDEVILPTLLQHNGFSLADFGGEGEFVLPGMQNKYYTASLPNREGRLESGTFRYRPLYDRPGQAKDKLYHPVKPQKIKWTNRVRKFLNSLFGETTTERTLLFLKSLRKPSAEKDRP